MIPYNWDAGNYDIVADYLGTSNIDVSTDTNTLTVDKTPTSTLVDSVHDFAGQTVDLVAHVTDVYGNVNDGQVQFTVNGVNAGTANVNNGIATLNWLIPSNWDAGNYNLVADYLGTSNYIISTDTNTLTVDKTPTSTLVDSVHDFAGQTVDLVAHVTDIYGNVNDGQVQFTVNGVNAGTANVNNGIATLNWLIPSNWDAGNYNLVADYLGTSNYIISTDTNTLTVDKTPTNTVVDAVHDFAGQTVDLVAHVTDIYGNVNDGKVQFTVNGVNAGTANVKNGIATLNWLIPSNWDAGNYNLVADYLGTSNIDTSTYINTLTVDKTPTSTLVDAVHDFAGQTVDLVAHVTDIYGNVNDGQVQFTVNGVNAGTVNVNNGIATLNWLIPSDWTAVKYNMVAIYLGSDNYLISGGENFLTVNPKATTSSLDSVNNSAGQKVDLVAHVVDFEGNPVDQGFVQFKIGTDSTVFATVHGAVAIFKGWIIPNNWKTGNYNIIATYMGTINYLTSTTTNTLTVNPTPTNITATEVSGNKDETVNLTAILKDKLDNTLLGGKTIKFYINGTPVGSAVTNLEGVATLPYTITQNGGSYYIDALFAGDNIYNSSTGGATLKVLQSHLYVTVTSSNNHPKAGETVKITFKVGNYGPDTANNVVLSLKIPEGMEYISATTDSGLFTYNPKTQTITWNIGDVPVGDPKLFLNVKIPNTGNYTLQPTITTATYDPNIRINTGSTTIQTSNKTNNNTIPVVNAETIPMQPTGAPIIPLLVGSLMMVLGIANNKRKN